MAQSTTVKIMGVLVAQPATPGLCSYRCRSELNLSFYATYGAAVDGNISIATPSSPTPLPFQGIAKGRAFAFRLLSGATMRVSITTALGVAVFNVSDVLLFHSPNPGDEITAISFQGTGDIAYALVGDVT